MSTHILEMTCPDCKNPRNVHGWIRCTGCNKLLVQHTCNRDLGCRRPYNCKVCKSSFKNLTHASRHMTRTTRRHHDNGFRQCHRCHKILLYTESCGDHKCNPCIN